MIQIFSILSMMAQRRFYSNSRFLVLLLVALGMLSPGSLKASENGPGLSQEEGMRLCEQRLRLVGQALEAYQVLRGKQTYPDSLSALVSEGLLHEAHRSCPIGFSGYQRSIIIAEDQESPKAYNYEFSNQPNLSAFDKGLFARGRDLKLAQATLLGDLGGRVPVVRCLNHGSDMLNLANGGKATERVFRSKLYWESETALVDRCPLPYLLGSEAFYDARPLRTRLEPRPASLSPNLIDLSPWYNSHLRRLLITPMDTIEKDRDFFDSIEEALEDSGLHSEFDCRGALLTEGHPGVFWQTLDRDEEGNEIVESFRIAPAGRSVESDAVGTRIRVLCSSVVATAVSIDDFDEPPPLATLEVLRPEGMDPIQIPIRFGEEVGHWEGAPNWNGSATRIPVAKGEDAFSLYAFDVSLGETPIPIQRVRVSANPNIAAVTALFALTID